MLKYAKSSVKIYRMKTILFALFASLLLSACGQKGALYLPEKPTPTPPAQAKPTDVEADTTHPNDY